MKLRFNSAFGGLAGAAALLLPALALAADDKPSSIVAIRPGC